VAHRGVVYIADTYNHKIKALDPVTRKVTTVADGFYEPGGLTAAGDRLFVADTNNHAIRQIDLKTRAVSTLEIDGLTPPESWSYLRRR